MELASGWRTRWQHLSQSKIINMRKSKHWSRFIQLSKSQQTKVLAHFELSVYFPEHLKTCICPARALRALGLLLADGTPTGGRGEDFLNRQPDFFTETAVTPERKVEKSFPRWEINRHVEG